MLIPHIPLSFSCLSINRRDGTSIAHSVDQTVFTSEIDHTTSAEIEQLENASDKCNQNVDSGRGTTASVAAIASAVQQPLQTPVASPAHSLRHQLPAAMAAGRAAVDRMSQSVHEARNQIFDDDHRRKKKKHSKDALGGSSSSLGSTSAATKCPPAAAAATPPSAPSSPADFGGHSTSASPLTFAMDASYGVLWSFNSQTGRLRCYNVAVSGGDDITYSNYHTYLPSEEDDENVVDQQQPAMSYVRTFLSPELTLPVAATPTMADASCMQLNTPSVSVTRTQAALNMLACLDVLAHAGADFIPACFEADPAATTDATDATGASALAASNEYQLVSRFENFGGGWGYSGHSVEAIRFTADTDIVLYGFAMFGGRGEYTCKLRLFDLGCDPSSGAAALDEDDGVLLAETDEIPYECPVRSKYNIMLPRPIAAAAGNWFLVWTRIAGPSSDCGSAGQASVTTEDQILFTFATSKKANNGTDVNSGQIPSVLYRVVTPECKPTTAQRDPDPVAAITRQFASGVTRECFESLVGLLGWSWRQFKATLAELNARGGGSGGGGVRDQRTRLAQTLVSLNRLVFVCRACLRLLRRYCNEIYPNDGPGGGGGRARNQQQQQATSSSSQPAPLGETQIYVLNQGPSQQQRSAGASGSTSVGKCLMGSSMDATTPTADRLAARKCNTENLQLAECIGDVRALLIQILCDELPVEMVGIGGGGGGGDVFGNADAASSTDVGYASAQRIFDECHTTFLACFNVFYPTATMKWNCLCDLLAQDEKAQQQLPTRLLSAIVGGLCSPMVKLRHTFQLLAAGGGANCSGNRKVGVGDGLVDCGGGGGNRDSRTIISPSDNSGMPMLTSMETHQYPVLVEQMIYRTQQEKCFRTNGWTFKDVLLRLLDIIAQPVRCRIENIYNRGSLYTSGTSGQLLAVDRSHNQRLIDNCCRLLARVLAEIVYESCSTGASVASGTSTVGGAVGLVGADDAAQPDDATALCDGTPAHRTLHQTGSRFARIDASRTWNTGNFGPDAVGFSVSRAGIAIAGAKVYSGSGSYEYQLELLYDTSDVAAFGATAGNSAAGGHGQYGSGVGAAVGGGGGGGGVSNGGGIGGQPHSKWETLETVTGTYDQDAVVGDMAELKFERAVPVRENVRYALRLCAQGARTCSGDAGMTSVRGPCGATFTFYPCDLSFNGTTTARGQLPCLVYYSSPVRMDADQAGRMLGEQQAREAALQIAGDIGRKCAELLVLARNALSSGGGIGGGAGGGAGGIVAAGSGSSPSDKSLNSSNNTQTIDSEQNITPIEEHLDIAFSSGGMAGDDSGGSGAGTSRDASMSTTAANATAIGGGQTISAARDHFSKRIESFSKGIMETLKFGDKRSSNNPFEFEIEIGATEIQECQKDERQPLQSQQQQHQQQSAWKRASIANGNAGDGEQVRDHLQQQHLQQQQHQQRIAAAAARRGSSFSDDGDADDEHTCSETLKLFESRSASIFHSLLPLVFAHVGALASYDPKVGEIIV